MHLMDAPFLCVECKTKLALNIIPNWSIPFLLWPLVDANTIETICSLPICCVIFDLGDCILTLEFKKWVQRFFFRQTVYLDNDDKIPILLGKIHGSSEFWGKSPNMEWSIQPSGSLSVSWKASEGLGISVNQNCLGSAFRDGAMYFDSGIFLRVIHTLQATNISPR